MCATPTTPLGLKARSDDDGARGGYRLPRRLGGAEAEPYRRIFYMHCMRTRSSFVSAKDNRGGVGVTHTTLQPHALRWRPTRRIPSRRVLLLLPSTTTTSSGQSTPIGWCSWRRLLTPISELEDGSSTWRHSDPGARVVEHAGARPPEITCRWLPSRWGRATVL